MALNYLDLKVSDLRDECKKRNLDPNGLKVHLVERLKNYEINAETNKSAVKESINDNSIDQAEAEMKNVAAITKAVEDSTTYDVKETIITSIKADEEELSLFEKALSEPDNWDCRTDVHLDFYNSDLNLIIDSSGFSAQTINENGFQYFCAGVKANYGLKQGKVYFEVKILKFLFVELDEDVGEPNCIKVGWSVNTSSLCLGEEAFSLAYCGSGKKLINNTALNYGDSVKERDVIGCFLECNDEKVFIRFSINGVDQGEAFNELISDFNDRFLLPHIVVRNVVFEVNFGTSADAWFPPCDESDISWIPFGKFPIEQRIRALLPPKSKADCEVLMMCGLPSCGKTAWVEKHRKENNEKLYNVLSTNVILERMKVITLRKKCATGRWDLLIQLSTQCLNKIIEIAVTKRRNFILDQTNVYPAAQRRRMKTFEEFIRKAIVIVPTDDEYQRRMRQVVTEEGKDVPESAVLQMKENFVIPEEGSDLFDEIIFVELQRCEAETLVKKYKEDVIALKKAEEEHNNNREDSDESDNTGLWGVSPKGKEGDSDRQSVSKKSRWNQNESHSKISRSRSRSREKQRSIRSGSSSAHSSRRSDYKGGFCFSREAGDSDKGGRRNDDRYSSRNRDRSRGRDNQSRHGGGYRRYDNYRGRPHDRQPYRRPGARDDRSYESPRPPPASTGPIVYGPPSMYGDPQFDYGTMTTGVPPSSQQTFPNPYQDAYCLPDNGGSVYQTYETPSVAHDNLVDPDNDYYTYCSPGQSQTPSSFPSTNKNNSSYSNSDNLGRPFSNQVLAGSNNQFTNQQVSGASFSNQNPYNSNQKTGLISDANQNMASSLYNSQNPYGNAYINNTLPTNTYETNETSLGNQFRNQNRFATACTNQNISGNDFTNQNLGGDGYGNRNLSCDTLYNRNSVGIAYTNQKIASTTFNNLNIAGNNFTNQKSSANSFVNQNPSGYSFANPITPGNSFVNQKSAASEYTNQKSATSESYSNPYHQCYDYGHSDGTPHKSYYYGNRDKGDGASDSQSGPYGDYSTASNLHQSYRGGKGGAFGN